MSNLSGQFGGEPLWKRPPSELPAHLQTGLGGSTEPRQLKMFMSGQEIMDEYQPLDGDRKPIDEDVALSGQHTRQSKPDNSRGYPVERRVGGGKEAWGNTTGGDVFYRSAGGTARKTIGSREEDDDEVWTRKAEESKLSPKDYDLAHFEYAKNTPEMQDISIGKSAPQRAKHEGTSTFEEREWDYYEGKEASQDRRYGEALEAYEDPDNSLFNRIAREGVKNPISLNDPDNYNRFGESGKPMVAGGHHRLSAQFEQDPDKLMPVLHWAGGTNEAKSSEQYKYT